MFWYLKVLSRYSYIFSGRASRKEFWMFMLFNIIFLSIAIILDNILGIASDVGHGLITLIYFIVVLIPGLAVVIRRLHDIGKNGWSYLAILILIPLSLIIVLNILLDPLEGLLLNVFRLLVLCGGSTLLVICTKDSNPNENKYGPNPKNQNKIK